MKAIVRLPGFKTAPQLGRGNEWRYYVVSIPDLPRLLRAKDEKRKSNVEAAKKISLSPGRFLGRKNGLVQSVHACAKNSVK